MKVTGLLLAGGQSTRFGADKARFEVEGRAMIARVAEVVSEVTDTLLVSVAEAGAAPLPERPAMQYVVDQVPGAGPLAGLHAGLSAATTPWVLAIACDMPFLTVEAVRTLLAARSPEADAVVARSEDGRLHPLCACYHVRVLPVAEAHLIEGKRALHAVLDALESVHAVDLPTGPLRNVNRPPDLENLKQKT